MNIFKSRKLIWWQAAILKLSLLSIGIAIGAQWYQIFLPFFTLLVAIGVILGVFFMVIWFNQK